VEVDEDSMQVAESTVSIVANISYFHPFTDRLHQENQIRKVCDWCLKMNRPNECHIAVSESGRRQRACGICTKSKRQCSLVDDARQSRTPSATPSARKRGSSRAQTPKSKPKVITSNTTKKATTSKAKTSKAGPSRSSSQAAKSRVPNTLSKSILSLKVYISSFLSDNT
jgi:hypothetical protein